VHTATVAGNTDFLVNAARFGPGEARTVLDSRLGVNLLATWPDGRTARDKVRRVVDAAVDPYMAIGLYLLARSQTDAMRMALQWHLEIGEQAKVLQGFDGTNFLFLKRCLDADMKYQAIKFDGHEIQETPAGWSCEGKNVCEASMRVDEIKTDRSTGTTVVSGSVSFQHDKTHKITVVPFCENLKKIQGQPGQWLQTFCLVNGKFINIGKGWQTKILDIATKFSVDRMAVVVSDAAYGWDKAGTLKFNRFVVAAQGLTRVVSHVGGPDLPMPQPLTAAEADSLKSRDFCSLALALLGNLYRTRFGQPGLNIAVEESQHLVARVGQVLGVAIQDNPRHVLDAGLPLPTPLAYTADDLGQLVATGRPSQCLASFDSQTFRLLATESTWVRLPVKAVPDYQALRWIFLVLPVLLQDSLAQPDDGYFFSNLATKLKPVADRVCPGHSLLTAANDLDRLWFMHHRSPGTALVFLLHSLVAGKQLGVANHVDGVVLRVDEVRQALTAPAYPPPDIARLTRVLAEGKMLAGQGDNWWVINGDVWSLMATNLLG